MTLPEKCDIDPYINDDPPCLAKTKDGACTDFCVNQVLREYERLKCCGCCYYIREDKTCPDGSHEKAGWVEAEDKFFMKVCDNWKPWR